MEQIEMQFQSSVNATECIVEIFGELAQRNRIFSPNFDVNTFEK